MDHDVVVRGDPPLPGRHSTKASGITLAGDALVVYSCTWPQIGYHVTVSLCMILIEEWNISMCLSQDVFLLFSFYPLIVFYSDAFRPLLRVRPPGLHM